MGILRYYKNTLVYNKILSCLIDDHFFISNFPKCHKKLFPSLYRKINQDYKKLIKICENESSDIKHYLEKLKIIKNNSQTDNSYVGFEGRIGRIVEIIEKQDLPENIDPFVQEIDNDDSFEEEEFFEDLSDEEERSIYCDEDLDYNLSEEVKEIRNVEFDMFDDSENDLLDNSPQYYLKVEVLNVQINSKYPNRTIYFVEKVEKIIYIDSCLVDKVYGTLRHNQKTLIYEYNK